MFLYEEEVEVTQVTDIQSLDSPLGIVRAIDGFRQKRNEVRDAF